MGKGPQPGLAFSLLTEVGFAVGLFTHDMPRIGSLIWVATPTFDKQPTLEGVGQITEWRWPILFPLAAAIRQHVVVPLGQVPIPKALQPFPTLRSGERRIGWVAFTEIEGKRRTLGPTTDRSLPIYQLVNESWLKQKVASGWRPDDDY